MPQKLHALPIGTVTQTQCFPRQGAFRAEEERPGDEATVEIDVRTGDKRWRQGGDGTAARKVGHRTPDRHGADEFRSLCPLLHMSAVVVERPTIERAPRQNKVARRDLGRRCPSVMARRAKRGGSNGTRY